MRRVPAAGHALAILRVLGSQADPMPATTTARAIGLPRSTTYHLLSTMITAGFVIHYPDQRVYGIGLAAFELSSGYLRQAPLQRLARKPIAELCDRCRHSVHLSVLLAREVVYVIEERAPGRPALITDVGVRLPALSTASGPAMLAALPHTQVRALFPDKAAFDTSPADGPRSPTELRRRLVDIRRAGYASEHGTVTDGLATIAMPVRDPSGYPVAAVAVTFPEHDRTDELVRFIAAEVSGTTKLLSRRLGEPAPW